MEPLRAPPRKVQPEARDHSGLIALAIAVAVAFAGLIWYVRHANDVDVSRPLNASTATTAPETVYVYRCADGRVESEPCQNPPATPTHELPSLMVYDAPHYRDDPRTRELIDRADARYEREVEAARQSRSEYEKTVAVTGSAECRALRNERDAINARMRQAYSSTEGEWFRDRLRANWKRGVELGCWSGTPSPR